jgi:hypothetical protein
MVTTDSDRGRRTAENPLRSNGPPARAPADAQSSSATNSLLLASLAAGLAALLSCAEPTAPSRALRRGAPIHLNATAAAAVRTVLADVLFRIGDAIEDGAVRSRFDVAVERLTANIEAGLLDAAEQDAAAARGALGDAATLDADGSGDADRSAIVLALNVANEEINNARLTAAGGGQ